MFVLIALLGLFTSGESSCTCGRATDRIVGGTEAKANQIPWIVGLGSHAGYVQCGGSIIDDQHILTAAHCIGTSPNTVNINGKAQVSELSLGNSNDGQQIFEIESFKCHEEYNQRDLDNDICIVKLKSKITFSEKAMPVCLPKRGEDFAGQTGTVSGWGFRFTGVPSEGNLLIVDIPIWNDTDCAKSPLEVNIKQHFCAGGVPGKDSCNQDSGGPLTVTKGGVTTLAGIVSYGSSNCGSRYPGAYAKVSAYIDWILKNSNAQSCNSHLASQA